MIGPTLMIIQAISRQISRDLTTSDQQFTKKTHSMTENQNLQLFCVSAAPFSKMRNGNESILLKMPGFRLVAQEELEHECQRLYGNFYYAVGLKVTPDHVSTALCVRRIAKIPAFNAASASIGVISTVQVRLYDT